MLKREDWLILTDVVAAECVFVLESYYELTPDRVAGLMRDVLELPSVVSANVELLLRSLETYERYGLDFADAYLAASAELSGVGAVASFDKAFDRLDSLERISA